MFENLTDRLSKTLQNLRGQGRLTEDNIRDSLREVRMALLEADVGATGGQGIHRGRACKGSRPGCCYEPLPRPGLDQGCQ